MASNAEAVLDLVVNGKSFFSDLDTAEKRSKALGSTFSQVGKQIDSFAQSMTGVGTNFEGLSGRISGVTASLGPAITGFISLGTVAATAAVAAGAALFGLAEGAAKLGAQLDDMSETSGVAVEKLSGFKFAADVTGQSFEAINSAIFKFQQRLGENSEEVSRGLQRIGLTFTEIAKLNPDQQFIAVAEAFNAITSPAQRAAAAVEIFGKQGRELIPLLSKDIEGLVKRSEELGFTWTAEEAKAAEAFEEKSNELRVTLQNVATVIGKELIPAFNIALDVSNWTLAKLLTEGPPGEAINALREVGLIIKGIQASIDLLSGSGLKPPKIASPTVAGVQPSVIGSADSVGRAFAEQATATKELAKQMADAKKEAKEFAEQQAKLALAADKAAEAFAKLDAGRVQNLRTFSDQLAQFGVEIIDLDTAIAATDEDITTFAQRQGVFVAATEAMTDGLVSMDDEVLALNKQLPTLADAILLFNEGKFKAGFTEIGEVMSALLDPISLVTSAILSLVSRGIAALEQLIEKGIIKLGQALGNLISTGLGKFLDLFGTGIGAVTAAAQAAAKVVNDLAAEKDAWEDLDKTIKKYKFSIEELGPALQRQRLDEQAQEIFHDWKILAAAGVNMLAIMRELGTNVQELVTNALKFHLELPEALRPLIQQMIEAGQLTDELGNKITNIDRLHFSQTMTQGFAAVVAAVDRLTAAILRTVRAVGSLNTAASAAARAAAAAAAAAQSGSSSSGNTGEPPVREAFGDYLHLVRPTQFLAAESGREDVVFGGAGRDLARDVAMELARLHPSATHAGATAGPAIIQLVVDSKVVAHAAMDGIHAGGEPRSKFDKLVGRLR